MAIDEAKIQLEMERTLEYLPITTRPTSRYDPTLLQRLANLQYVRDVVADFDK